MPPLWPSSCWAMAWPESSSAGSTGVAVWWPRWRPTARRMSCSTWSCRSWAWHEGEAVRARPRHSTLVGTFEVHLRQAHLLGDLGELIADLEHTGRAFLGIGLKAGDDQGVEVGGNARIELVWKRDLPFVSGLGNGPLHE